MKILDCTIRDGGYVNNWDFDIRFVGKLAQALQAANVDYIELGFVDPRQTPKDKDFSNLSEETIDIIKEEYGITTPIAAMVNCYKGLSHDVNKLPKNIDLLRIATHYNTFETALLSALYSKTNEAAVNFMGISNYNEDQIKEITRHAFEYKRHINYYYVADSFGACTPKKILQVFNLIKDHFDSFRQFGFHPHDNTSCAFANTLAALDAGAGIVDSSVLGMGRGAGNLKTELLVGYLEHQQYNYSVLPILEFIDNEMFRITDQYAWGPNSHQMLSGLMSTHPNYATKFQQNDELSLVDTYKAIRALSPTERKQFKG